MPTRVAIEVCADRCHLIDAEVRQHSSPHTPIAPTRVRAFDTFEWTHGDYGTLRAGLRRARTRGKLARRAWVTVWGLPTAYRFLQLPPADPAHLEALARRDAADDLLRLGCEPSQVATGIMLGEAIQADGKPRRSLSFVAVSTADLAAQLEAITAAGFSVEGVTVPAVALASMARLLRAPDAAVAYLALGAEASSLAIVRNGLLLFAREIAWGYQGHARVPDRDALVERLASELRRSFLYFKQTFREAVDRVVTCGDYPHLRILTAPLSTALAVPAETLDSTDGIDIEALPEPADRFRANVAALRLAWATAADGGQSVNLLPPHIRARRARRRMIAMSAAAGAAAAAIAAAAYWPIDRVARGREATVEQLRRDIARMEPAARAVDATRHAATVEHGKRAALEALDAHGPRLARALEAVAAATAEGVTLSELSVKADGGSWRMTLAGVAVADEPAASQAAVNALLRQLGTSAYLGTPIAPPSLRIVAGSRGQGPQQPTGSNERPAIPAGKSGVQFSVELPVPR